jgi:predicted nuclease of predicted toxin-antitoxin system
LTAKRILLDENLPTRLRFLLHEYDVFTVAFMGWAGIKNCDLLNAAEGETFDVLITSDQGFPHQQNMEGRNLAILLLPTPDWNVVQYEGARISAAIEKALPGTFERVLFETKRRARKRASPEPG